MRQRLPWVSMDSLVRKRAVDLFEASHTPTGTLPEVLFITFFQSGDLANYGPFEREDLRDTRRDAGDESQRTKRDYMGSAAGVFNKREYRFIANVSMPTKGQCEPRVSYA